jgi:hypothetical protein
MTGIVESIGDDIADHPATAVPYVKRAVRIGGNELHLNSLAGSRFSAGMIGSADCGLAQHLAIPVSRKCEVDETGTRDFGGLEIRDLR